MSTEDERTKPQQTDYESSAGLIQNLPEPVTGPGQTGDTQLARYVEPSQRINAGIFQSMDSLNRAADKLTCSMESSESSDDIVKYAEALVGTVGAQATMVTTLAEAIKTLEEVRRNRVSEEPGSEKGSGERRTSGGTE